MTVMEDGILSLRWNNHTSAFTHCLASLLEKDAYSDVTLACDGLFFPVHKLVLSVCSEYFEDILSRTTCSKPVIVLKDIRHCDLRALLNYMYAGEANVPQSDLARLIKAAECLRVKGLAVNDESPQPREKKRPAGENITEHNAPKKRKGDFFVNSVHDNQNYDVVTALNSDGQCSDSEGRRFVLQHAAQPPVHTIEDTSPQPTPPPHQSISSPVGTPIQVTVVHHPLHQQQHSGVETHHQVLLQSQLQPHRQISEEENSSTHDDVLVSHTIPEVLVEECAVVKEELKEPIKEEGGSGSSGGGGSAPIDGGHSEGEGGLGEDEEDVEEEGDGAHTHHEGSSAGLMHDLLSIPGTTGQQQETLVTWDSGSGSLASYTLEGFIPDDLRQHQAGAAGGGAPAVEGSGGGVTIAGGGGSSSAAVGQSSGVTVMGCPYCQRAFMYRSDLSRHVRTHTGERPYTCPHCPYRASQKSHLLEHVKRRHRPATATACSSVGLTGATASSAVVVNSSSGCNSSGSSSSSSSTSVGISSGAAGDASTLVVPGCPSLVMLVPSCQGVATGGGSHVVATAPSASHVAVTPSLASVHHTILHTPSHSTAASTVTSSAAVVCQQQQISAGQVPSSHGLLYTPGTHIHSVPATTTHTLLYSPSHSPPHNHHHHQQQQQLAAGTVLHTPHHVQQQQHQQQQQQHQQLHSTAVTVCTSSVTGRQQCVAAVVTPASAMQHQVTPCSSGVQHQSTPCSISAMQHQVTPCSSGVQHQSTPCSTSALQQQQAVMPSLHTPSYTSHHSALHTEHSAP